jgi:hypothetical protein
VTDTGGSHENSNDDRAVGGGCGGIPMTIHFIWNLSSSESIVGELSSTVSKTGVTCHMSRRFDMDYAGP